MFLRQASYSKTAAELKSSCCVRVAAKLFTLWWHAPWKTHQMPLTVVFSLSIFEISPNYSLLCLTNKLVMLFVSFWLNYCNSVFTRLSCQCRNRRELRECRSRTFMWSQLQSSHLSCPGSVSPVACEYWIKWSILFITCHALQNQGLRSADSYPGAWQTGILCSWDQVLATVRLAKIWTGRAFVVVTLPGAAADTLSADDVSRCIYRQI